MQAVARSSPEGRAASAPRFIAADLRSAEGAKAFPSEAVSALGGVDILVNIAGAARPHLGGTAAIPDQEWQDSLDINFLSAVRLTNALLPSLKQSQSGVILNVSSGGVTPLAPPLAHYDAAKAALNRYTLGLAQELSPDRIRVNIVTPGPVLTPGGDAVREPFIQAMGATPEAVFAQVPLGRAGQPSELAEMVAFLASGRGSWITGHNYYVDGGAGAK